ncbi:hypothetical protein F5X99DRAFT_398893 [Biscogniauxia marginata]|nr:hypothetical protein F5X99DRAFT_398893 [Biscogniauxia marginata]
MNDYFKLSGQNIYCVIFNQPQSQYYEYTTTKNTKWPPTKEFFDTAYPVPVKLGPGNVAIEKKDEEK